MNLKSDPFWDVERTCFESSEGDVELPIFYYDFSMALFTFFIKPKNLESILEGTGLKPCVFLNNRSVAILVFFEYRDTSVGIYNEVGLCSLTYSEKCRKPFFYLPGLIGNGDNWKIGAYVHNLPVTTKEANAAGKEIWGYPKFVTDIPFSLGPKTFGGAVKDPDTGDDIVSLSGSRGRVGLTFPAIDIVSYTIHRGEHIRTCITTDDKAKYSLYPNIRLKVGSGDHIMTRNLRGLGLDNKRPFSLTVTQNTRSRLPEGIVVTPDMFERLKNNNAS